MLFRFKNILLSLLALFFITSCASTFLDAVWKDENYQGKLSKVIILAIADDKTARRLHESEFASQLRSKGVNVTAGHNVFPSDEKPESAAVKAKLTGMDLNKAVITRVIGEKTVESYIPPQNYHSMYSYYGGYSGYSGGHVQRDQLIVLETNIYDIKSEQLIWSARSDTFIDDATMQVLIKEHVNILVQQLAKDELL